MTNTPIKKAAGGFKTTPATASHNATDFIAACARQASATATFRAKPWSVSTGFNIPLQRAVLQFFLVL